MSKNNAIDLDTLNVDELRAITENAQQLIAKKQHQRLYDAYMQFEKIAEDLKVLSTQNLKKMYKILKKLHKILKKLHKNIFFFLNLEKLPKSSISLEKNG